MKRVGAIGGDEGNSRPHEQGITYDIRMNPAFGSLVSEIMDLFAAPSTIRPELECLLCRYLPINSEDPDLKMMQEGDFAFSEQMHLSSEKWHSGHQINEAEPRNLQLRFLNKVCERVSTGVPIKGENFEPLKIALFDSESGKVVTTGPEASARVKIVVLEADFGGCLGDSWTPEEFKTKIVTKEGNRQVLTGNLVVDLKEGKACVGIVQFSHTKIWMKQHEYRLGIVAMDDYIGTKIQDGFSDTFVVKDHRLDLNRKNKPPNLSDAVWRLKGIARDGAFHQRLSDEKVNINTVEDLLKKLNTDPHKLRHILGKNMSAKMWEALVDHARTCVVDETLYLFSSSEHMQKTRVLFNMVGQVMGLISEFQYFSFEMLSESEKAHAKDLVVSAFQQWDKVASFHDKASFDKYLGSNQIVYHLKSPTTESSSSIKILIPPKNDELDLPQTAISFDDKASLFDESPGLSIVYPPKSLNMEGSCGSKKIIYPKNDALDFPQPTVSFYDMESLLDESPSLNNIILPPKSPIEGNSSGTLISVSQKNDDLDFPPPAFSFDDVASLFDEPPGPSNVICPLKSPIEESCSGCKILISPEINELDFPKPVIPSQEIIPTDDSVWEMSYYNDCNWPCVGHERRLSYSSQVTDSETESMIQSWWEENYDISLQFSVDDVPLDTPGLISESVDNPQNYGNEPLVTRPRPTAALMNNTRKRYLRNKANRKWRVLSSVMRWLFERRNASGKLSVGGLPVKLSSSYQDSQPLDSVDSWLKQPLTIVGDCVVPTSYETKSFQIFGSHPPFLSGNSSMKSEANLHSAVNDILFARSVAVATNTAKRKYVPKSEKARRRWKKLYSVMRWFSVQRNATKRASSALIIRDPSCSTSLDGLSAMWTTDSSRHDGYIRNWDTCPNQQNSMSFACPFHDDEFVQLFNTFCSLQPRNRIAMNRLARRKNAADRNFAQRRWRMLFSIMKWLSVRRSAARVKGSI